MELHETVDMIEPLTEYIECKFGKEHTARLMDKWGLDDPHILKTRTLDDWKKLIDKLAMANKLMEEKNEKS